MAKKNKTEENKKQGVLALGNVALRADAIVSQKDLDEQGDLEVPGSGLDRTGLLMLKSGGEARQHAMYQARTAPWITHPAVMAIMNTLANNVARLPCCQINEKGEEKPLPEVFSYPLGRVYNPTFMRYDLMETTVRNLYWFGTSHTLVEWNENKKPKYVIPLDSSGVNTLGSYMRPRWLISRTSVTFAGGAAWGGQSGLLRPEYLPECEIYPDGRYLDETDLEFDEESRNYGMLLIALNRTPESNNGVPPGMLNFEGTLAALNAQRHSAEFFRDGTWNQMLLSPHYAIGDFDNVQATSEDIAKALKASHRAIIAGLPYETKPLGFHARDSQLTESREADMGFMSIAHGLPASLFNTSGASYAQIYAETIRLFSDGILPLVCKIEQQFSRLLDDGWMLKFDTTALKDGDPQSAAKIAEIIAKVGGISTDELRDRVGYTPLGEEWSSEHFMDGNRRTVEKLAEAEAGAKKPANRPTEAPKPEAEYPEPPSSD